jgi:hypothetical protein
MDNHTPGPWRYTAPDLLEALKLSLPILETHEDTQLVGHEGCLWPVELARAAIAKARGQADDCPAGLQVKKEIGV